MFARAPSRRDSPNTLALASEARPKLFRLTYTYESVMLRLQPGDSIVFFQQWIE